MKLPLALTVCVLVAGSIRAQTAPAPAPAEESAPAAKSPPPAKPAPIRIVLSGPGKAEADAKEAAEKAAAEKKTAAPKPTEPAKIPGVEVVRANGGFLGVQLVGGSFKISFFDAKKKPMAPDVVRALLRWDPKNKKGRERVVLNLDADGLSLSAPRPIRPPYAFKLFITLLKEATEEEEPVGESFAIDFRA